jgi:putative endonuclease
MRRPSGPAELGDRGEDVAARFLQGRGYRVLQRSFRVASGEIDIVARDGDWLVFVEVKTRSDDSFAEPAESVTRAKQRRLARAAIAYLRRLGSPPVPPFRFDIVEVVWRPRSKPVLRLHRDAFPMPQPYFF